MANGTASAVPNCRKLGHGERPARLRAKFAMYHCLVFIINIRWSWKDSIRDPIRTQTADSQVPRGNSTQRAEYSVVSISRWVHSFYLQTYFPCLFRTKPVTRRFLGLKTSRFTCVHTLENVPMSVSIRDVAKLSVTHLIEPNIIAHTSTRSALTVCVSR